MFELLLLLGKLLIHLNPKTVCQWSYYYYLNSIPQEDVKLQTSLF